MVPIVGNMLLQELDGDKAAAAPAAAAAAMLGDALAPLLTVFRPFIMRALPDRTRRCPGEAAVLKLESLTKALRPAEADPKGNRGEMFPAGPPSRGEAPLGGFSLFRKRGCCCCGCCCSKKGGLE